MGGKRREATDGKEQTVSSGLPERGENLNGMRPAPDLLDKGVAAGGGDAERRLPGTVPVPSH